MKLLNGIEKKKGNDNNNKKVVHAHKKFKHDRKRPHLELLVNFVCTTKKNQLNELLHAN